MLSFLRRSPRRARRAPAAVRRPTPTALLVLLVTGLALGTAGPAAARPFVRVAHDSPQTPIRVSVDARTQDTLGVWLNGKRVDGVFTHTRPGTRVGMLGANDGARGGRNRLRVRVTRRLGGVVRATRTIVLPAGPVAGAGRDLHVIGIRPVRLSARSTRATSTRHRLSYRWRVVGAPRGSKPKLTGADSATPQLKASANGTYSLRLAVTQQHPADPVDTAPGSDPDVDKPAALPLVGSDTVTVNVAPNDPTVGVPFDALADSSGAIAIAGETVRGTGGGRDNPLSYAVLSRRTRAIEASGAVAASAAGLTTIQGAISANATADHLVIVNGTAGIEEGLLDQFQKLTGTIGGQPLAFDAREALKGRRPFSMIGVPTSPAGSLQANFFSATSIDPAARKPDGDLSGLLQLNAGIAAYGVVSRDYVHFSTDAASGAITIGGKRYTRTLGAGRNGFHVLSLDSRTLGATVMDAGRSDRDKDEQVFETNSGDAAKDAAAMSEMVQWLNMRTTPAPYFAGGSPLIVVQSIGRPRPQEQYWGIAADRIATLGGTRQTFNALDGSGGYALVGRAPTTLERTAVVEAAETSTQTSGGEPARLAGLLSRDRDGAFSATLADTDGTLNVELLQTIYQPATPFPAFSGGQQAANANIADRLRLAIRTDVRANYTRSYTLDWGDMAARLRDLAFPADPSGFTPDEFRTVKTRLGLEIAALVELKAFVANLQSPSDTAFASYIDLERVSQKIQGAVHAPDVTQRTNAAKIFEYGFLAISKLVEGPAAEAAGFLNSAFEHIAGMTAADGSELLGPLQTRTGQLQADLLNRYEAARTGLRMIGLIAAGDYGKLMKIADKSTSDQGWIWPEQDTLIRTAMRKGAKRYFYSQLLPIAYVQYHLTGPTRANDWYCKRSSTGYQAHVFQDAPDSAQYVAIDRYRDGPFRADTSARALGQADVTGRFASQPNAAKPPSAELMDPLFRRLDALPDTDNLGIDKPTFFEHAFALREEPVPFSFYC